MVMLLFMEKGLVGFPSMVMSVSLYKAKVRPVCLQLIIEVSVLEIKVSGL